MAGGSDFFDGAPHGRSGLVEPKGQREWIARVTIGEKVPTSLLCPATNLPFDRVVVQVGDGVSDVFVIHLGGDAIVFLEERPFPPVPTIRQTPRIRTLYRRAAVARMVKKTR